MLGVFRRDVNTPDPLAPENPGPDYIPALKDGYLEKYFASINRHSVIVRLGTYGLLAYSTDKNPSPKPIFCMRGGIYCIYRGHMKMMDKRKKTGEKGNEADMLIACYAELKAKGKKTPYEVMQVLGGDYNYIIFDCFGNMEGPVRGAIAVNCWEDMSVYYGHDSEDCCIIADDKNIMEKVCGDSYKLIPKGFSLLIPVLTGPKLVPADTSSSADSGSEKEKAGRPTEANPSGGSSSSVAVASKDEPAEAKSSDGCSSKKTSEIGATETNPSGGSGSVVAPKADSMADNPTGGSQASNRSKKAIRRKALKKK